MILIFGEVIQASSVVNTASSGYSLVKEVLSMTLKNVKYFLFEAVIFGLIYLASILLFKNEYLFQWALHNWKFTLVLTLLPLILLGMNYKAASFVLFLGISGGIFLGNFLGNTISEQNILKITDGMSAEQIYHLNHHPGFEIWMLSVGISLILGLILQVIVSRKSKI